MPLYSYKARNDAGRIFTGEIKTDNKDGVAALLTEKGFTPIEVIEKNIFNDISQISFLKKKVKIKDLAVFCRQFAIVLEAGVPIATAMDVLREQTQNPTLKSALSDVYENIQKGISLSESLKQHSDCFPELLINMVEAGELSGQLEIVFKRLADHFEKEFKLNQKVKGAMTYPIIVLVVATLVIAILMIKVVPTFSDVLQSMGGELPIYTKILISVSKFFQTYWYFIALGIILSILVIRYYIKTPGGKKLISKLLTMIPIIKEVTRMIVTARFTRTLSTMLASGVLLIHAMEVVKKVLNNAVIEFKMEYVIDEIKKGRGMNQPLSSLKYFPPMLDSMIKIGEESGSIDFALEKAADFFDEELETKMQQLTALLEPIITIFMGIFVAFIIFSIIIPMYSVYETIGQQ